MSFAFTKMHGLGNDFVILDAREKDMPVDSALVRAIADRRRGIGCDQVIVLMQSSRADIRMRIYNADGGEVAACGNATRCVPVFLDQDNVKIETKASTLMAKRLSNGRVQVDMGKPRLDWDEIPLAHKEDTLHLEISAGPLTDAVAVNMGNPHAVFFVEDNDSIELETYGPELEHHPLFPERANIGIARILDRHAIQLRVWERGVGETQACGTGACAALVAAVRRELTESKATIELTGGELEVEWRQDGHVMMTGPAAISFQGEFRPEDIIKATTSNISPQEVGGPKGPEPTRYGDWEVKGRVSDF